MEKSWEWHGTVVGYYSPNIHEAKMPSVPLKWEKMAIKSWMEWGTPEIVGWNLSPEFVVHSSHQILGKIGRYASKDGGVNVKIASTNNGRELRELYSVTPRRWKRV